MSDIEFLLVNGSLWVGIVIMLVIMYHDKIKKWFSRSK